MRNGSETPARRTHAANGPSRASHGVWMPVGLVILHGVPLWLAPAIPAHRLLFLVSFFTVVLLPGYLLSTIIARRANLPVRALLSLVCGTAVTYGLLTIFATLRWKLWYRGIAAPLVSVALLVLRHRRDHHGAPADREPTHLERETPASTTLVIVAVLAFVCILIAFSGDPLLYTGDSPDHIAYIQTVSRTGDAFPDRFLYPDGGTLTRDIRKGLAHAMWGTLNVLTGRIDTLAVWPLMSMIGSVSILLTLFRTGSILMGSATVGLIAAFLFLIIYNGRLANYQLVTLAYTFPLGKIFYIVIYTPEKLRTARADGYRNLFDLYEALNTHVPDGCVIASDPLTSFSIPAFTNIERLYNHPTLFIPLYQAETAALFTMTDALRHDIPEDEEYVPRHIDPTISPDETAALTPSGIESIYIKDLTLSRRSIRRGERLTITIDWVSSRPCAPSSYTAFVRFDTDYEKGSLCRDWYSKLYRKAYELIRGGHHRFTTTHPPLDGIYPPDRWQPFRVTRDRWTITVPPDLSPGLYRVGVKLLEVVPEEVPHAPYA